LVTRHDDVRAVLGDPEAFSSDLRDPTNPVLAGSPLIFDVPPRHTELRRLLARAFTGARVAALEPALVALGTELLQAWDDGPADFVPAYADPFPVRAIAVMLGVPEADHARFKQWSEDRAAVVYRGPGSPADAGAAALDAYLRDLVADRRRTPRGDLLSALVAEGVEEAAGVGAVLLSAGNLTTTRLLANVVHALATVPGLHRRIREEPGSRTALVEESLRLDSPVQMPARRATRDAAIGGSVIPAGAFVMVGVGAANRDPAAYPGPGELRPGRDGPPHLAFGHGIHFCLGAALARLEAAVTLELLAQRCQAIELVAAAVRTPSIAHRGWDALPVALVRER
jgi:cytochrome P450